MHDFMANLGQCELAAVYVEAVSLASASPNDMKRQRRIPLLKCVASSVFADALH